MWRTVKYYYAKGGKLYWHEFAKYEINEDGIIRNKDTLRLMSMTKLNGRKNYYTTTLTHSKDDKGNDGLVKGSHTNIYCHVAVCSTFHELAMTNPDGTPFNKDYGIQVDHIDHNTENNHSDNLRWVDGLYNRKNRIPSCQWNRKQLKSEISVD